MFGDTTTFTVCVCVCVLIGTRDETARHLRTEKVGILKRINLPFLSLKSKDVIEFWFLFIFVLIPRVISMRKMKTENNLFVIPTHI